MTLRASNPSVGSALVVRFWGLGSQGSQGLQGSQGSQGCQGSQGSQSSQGFRMVFGSGLLCGF